MWQESAWTEMRTEQDNQGGRGMWPLPPELGQKTQNHLFIKAARKTLSKGRLCSILKGSEMSEGIFVK